MRCAPPPRPTREARDGARDRGRHRRGGRGRLQPRGPARRVGRAGFELAKDAVVVEDDAGTIDRLRPLPRRRPARGRSTRGARARARARRCSSGPSGAAPERGRRTAAPGRRRPRRRAPARCSRPHGYGVRAQLLADGARRRAATTRSRDGLRALAPEDAPALYAIHEAAFSRIADYEPPRRGDLDPARVQRPRPRPRRSAASSADGPAASRSSAAGRTTSPTSRCSPSHPDHAGQGLGGALLTRVFAAAARRRAPPGRAQRRLRQPERACVSTSASG